MDEINNAIGAIIRKKYTNIHPSIEWRFLEEANKILSGKNTDPEPIIFRDVYPFYGQADVVGSTTERNRAVQADMIENWEELLNLLQLSKKYFETEKTNSLIQFIKEILTTQQTMITPDEELENLELVTTVIHPHLDMVSIKYPQFASIWKDYQNRTDPNLRIITARRKNYEDSMRRINQTIVTLLDQEEAAMQKVLPHYFERNQTDGVSYDLYLGNALLKMKFFELQQLETFRLWQLKLMCEMTRKIAKLQPQLSHQMTTCLLYTSPSPRDQRGSRMPSSA